jgi:hypothetical protein
MGQDDRVGAAVGELLVPEDSWGRLECKTRGLDYIDKAEEAK